MNTIRLLTNGVVKTNIGVVNLSQNLLKELCLANVQRAVGHRSFIRNTTTTPGVWKRQQGERWSSGGGAQKQLDLLSHQAIYTTTICSQGFSSRKLFSTKKSADHTNKSDTKSAATTATDVSDDLFGEASKLGLVAKFKLMYKKYWYVLVPVHVVTSVGWLGGFYYLSQRCVCKQREIIGGTLEHLFLLIVCSY